jgi:SpoVK/Ycf46/Vps4 family AAA+-type ATPase
MVRSLVVNHFANKAAEQNDPDASHSSDLVSEKGKGLVILLHGAPSVGKTSTAECVAEFYGKLLFPITCSDLGLTASQVEEELSEKFHLAEKWKCVLLLDEADVFLAQRTRTDVKRNSLVSVFLRVLEYFSGIIFLITEKEWELLTRLSNLESTCSSTTHLWDGNRPSASGRRT